MKIKGVLEREENILFAILFGSVAEGRQNAMSDLDVGIYLKGDISLPEIGLITSGLEKSLSMPVDLVVLNDLYRKSPLVAFNVVKSGLVLFCRDEEAFVSFKRYTFLFYLDAKHLIDKTNRAMLERIREGKFGVLQNA